MNLWDKLDDLETLAADATGPSGSQRYAPHSPVCQECGVEMQSGGDVMFCPSCHQEYPCDLETALQPPSRMVVVTKAGEICSYSKVVYDRRAQLIKHYATYDKVALDYGIIFPVDRIERAVDILHIVQNASTANRGRNLTELMGGALFVAICEAGLPIAETTMAKIFNTKGGLSRGKNGVLTLLVKEFSLSGESPHAYLRKDAKKLASHFIKNQMLKVGLNVNSRNLYLFLKALIFIEDLYGYIDTQIINAKVAGSIYYYHVWLDREHCDPTILPGQDAVNPTAAAIGELIKTRLDISKETLMKYFYKLGCAKSIREIARIFNVRLRAVAPVIAA
jgi:hypothetical protein